MSPRPGGEADKLGNHYEGAWTVLHILEVLAGTAESVTVEELGEIGKGAEFTLRRKTTSEVHQVKRQRGSANYWKLGDLHAEGVLSSREPCRCWSPVSLRLHNSGAGVTGPCGTGAALAKRPNVRGQPPW